MRKPLIRLPDRYTEDTKNITLVASTARLARELRYRYDYEKQQDGARVWQRPHIQTFTQWLTTAYAELGSKHPELANRTVASHELFLLIAQQRAPSSDVEMHARAITDAWQLFWDANLWPQRKDLGITENGHLCDDWFRRIENFLQRENLITIAELPAVLQRAIEREAWRPAPLLSTGFEEISAAQRNLFKTLEELGVHESVALPFEELAETSIELQSYDDSGSELLALAMWTREKLAKYGATASIGAVIQNLGESRAVLQRCFESVFPEVDDITRLISIEAGQSFSEHALCHDLITLLRWTHAPMPHSALLSLARSSYFPQLKLERQPCIWFEERMSIRKYVRRLAKDDRSTLERIIKELPKRQPLSFVEAVACVGNIVRMAGFNKDSIEPYAYIDARAVHVVNELLTRLTQLAGVLPRISWEHMVDLIASLANDAVIDTTRAEAPVQIMSRNASKHLAFDALWVNGVADAEWPAMPRPNPFIPRSIQHLGGIPRVTHEQMFDEARQLTSHWQHCADELVFSYVSQTDSVEAQPSRLVTGFLESFDDVDEYEKRPFIENLSLIEHGHPWALHVEAGVVREYQQKFGTAISKSDARASTAMLRLQTLCPFRAWSVYRAGMREPYEAQSRFPDMMQRGTVFHDVIGALLQKADNLAAMAEIKDEGILDAIDQAIESQVALRDIPARFKHHERLRIMQLIKSLLEYEVANRKDVKVLEIEQPVAIELNGLTFNGRIDRIDSTDAQERLVIDFKTSNNYFSKKWDPAELSDTQMPLYAIGEVGCDGVAYLKTFRESNGEIKTKIDGVIKTDQPIERPKRGGKPDLDDRLGDYTSLDELKTAWRDLLAQKVQDHLEGRADVQPINEDACNYCHLSNACRIYERSTNESDED